MGFKYFQRLFLLYPPNSKEHGTVKKASATTAEWCDIVLVRFTWVAP